MTDNIDNVIGQALRKAQEGAKQAGYGSDSEAGSEAQERRTTVLEATEAQEAAGTLRKAGRVPVERLGVSVRLGGGSVLVTYPEEYRRVTQIPMHWITDGTEQTDKVLSLTCDPAWIKSVVLNGTEG